MKYQIQNKYFKEEIEPGKYEKHYFHSYRESSGQNKQAAHIACHIFVTCDECEELLIVCGKEETNIGKLAIFMKGENLTVGHARYMQEYSTRFLPLGILARFFIFEDNVFIQKEQSKG